MAIAYARLTIYSRSKGQSAVAAAAYRAAERLIDHRTNETHDYRKRDSRVYTEICLPENADKIFLDREYFWNQVERSEKRKDAQLAKDLLIALPKEINQRQHICLVKEFANEHFILNGIPVDISIHDKEDENPFAYILATTRRLIGDRFDRCKARDLDPSFGKGFLTGKDYWGKKWGSFQTEYFKRNGIQANVDSLHVIPQVHEGQITNAEKHYLKEENKHRKTLSAAIPSQIENQA